jgi:hypothetical protein
MLDEVNLDNIIDAIDNEKCILLLGPELNNLDGGLSNEKTLSDYLVSKGIAHSFNETDGLFLFDHDITEDTITSNLKKFYNNKKIPDIYDQIASIRFHLIISITPDLFLKRAFEKLDFNKELLVYDKNENPEEIKIPNQDIPLLCYLFGSYEKPYSEVLSYEDLFDFFEAILSKNKLPENLRNQLLNAQNLLFLGFRFDHWYVQFLLRLLRLSNKEGDHKRRSAGKYALSETIKPETKVFYVEEFRMKFFDTGITEFVSQLYEVCKTQKKLRNQLGKEVHSIGRLKNCAGKGDLEEAFRCLSVFIKKEIPGSDKENLNHQIILLSAHFENIKGEFSRGTITKESFDVEKTRILESVLTISNNIEDLLSNL